MQINFDEIKVPTEKLNQTVKESMESVQKEHRKKRKRNIIGWGSAAAAAIVAFVGFGISNPVLASQIPLVGQIFERIQDKQQYAGNFSEVAEPVNGNTVSESQGMRITLSEIYCNQAAMNVSVLIESEKPFPEDGKGVRTDVAGNKMTDENGNEICDLFLHGRIETDFFEQPLEEEIQVTGEYIDECTFAGAFRIDFRLNEWALTEIPDKFQWSMDVDWIKYFREDGMTYNKIDGNWILDTAVTKKKSDSKIIEVNEFAPNGEGIQSVTVTPYEVSVDFIWDETKVRAGYEEFDFVQECMLDADGKRIKDKIGKFSPTGYNLSKITVYYFPTPSEEVYMEIQEKIEGEEADRLPEYLDEIAIHKIEIGLE